MLAVQIHQLIPNLAQYPDRDKTALHIAAAAPLGRYHPRQDKFSVFNLDAALA